MTQDIEKRIREHYCAANGEWLVEKGKVKEGRLLKEACEVIESIRSENQRLWASNLREKVRLNEREEAIQKREKELEKRETSIFDRLNSLTSYIDNWKTKQ